MLLKSFGTFKKDNEEDSFEREVGKAVLIAGLSALATEVAQWVVKEIRDAVTPPPREEEKRDGGDKHCCCCRREDRKSV